VPPMKIYHSIWADVRARASVEHYELDKRAMEALLCEDPKAPKGKKKKVVKKEKKAGVVTLLEAKRQQNIGIALAQFKCSQEDIRAAILKMDMAPAGMLSTDKLQALLVMIPSHDETKTLQAYLKKNKGDSGQLGPPERMAIMLAALPHINDWLGALLFREEFKVRKVEIEEKLTVALECAAAVRTSEVLKEVFALVLTIGLPPPPPPRPRPPWRHASWNCAALAR
jgi:hypothetical protein